MKKLKTFSPYILFSVLILMSLAYGYFEIFNFKPYGMHYWRQTDCLAFAGNYFQNDLTFFKPEIYWLGYSKNGAVASEFPILYYLTAKIWQFTGQKEIVLRLINNILVFSGLFSLFLIFSGHIKSQFWSLISVVLLFTSPILVYYTNNFLPDAPAFGLALTGLFFAWKYYNQYKVKYLYVTALFFLFAGLLKISALIGLFALIPIHMYLLFFDKDKRIKFNTIIPFIIMFSGIVLWYTFAVKYNNANLGGVFRQGISPIWEQDDTSRLEIFLLFKKNMIKLFFNEYVLILMGILFFLVIARLKSANKFLLTYFIFLLIGSIGYFLLFYVAFNGHDYYMVPILLIIPAFLLLFIDLFRRINLTFFNNRWTKISVSGIAFALIILTAQINRQKYFSSENDFLVKHGIYEIDQKWEWHHYNYNQTFKALEDIRPYLAKIGISKHDKIISIPDDTPNFSLYMMGYKGWSDYGHSPERNEESLNDYLKLGAKYLVVNDTTIFTERKFLQKYTKKLFGQHKNVFIYKLN